MTEFCKSDTEARSRFAVMRLATAPLLAVFLFSPASVSAAVSFSAPTTYAVAGGPFAIAAADFNHDGILDLVVVGQANTFSYLQGMGNGTFKPPVSFSSASMTSATSCSLAVADFNNDGNLDLAITHCTSQSGYNGFGNQVTVHLGDGTGNFSAPGSLFTTGGSDTGITSADFNGDGKMDLAIGSQDAGSVFVHFGNGDGTFTLVSQLDTDATYGAKANFVAAIDLNKDGHPDLIAANGTGGSVSVFLNNGAGGFGPPTLFSTGSGSGIIVGGDFNHDGNVDLAVSSYGGNSVTILLGNGSGGFVNAGAFAANGPPSGLAAADFDKDGNLDVLSCDDAGGPVTILLGAGNGQLAPGINLATGSLFRGVSVGDFNGDGMPDFAVVDHIAGTVSVFLNGTAPPPPPTCVTPPSGLISWWPGDGNANDIQGANNGTLVGGVSFAAGEVGQAFSFNGTSQYVDVGLLNLPNTFTIDAWVNPNSFANNPFIVDKDDGNTQRSYFFQIEAAGTLVASVRNTFGGFTQYRTSLPVITTGQWQHIALTYDGGAGIGQKMKLYVNGISYPTSVIGPVCCPGAYDLGGTPESDALTTKIGIWGDTTTYPFNGLIDELEIFNRVLAGPEIQAIYAAGSAGKCKPVVDTTPPNVTPTVTGTLGSNGWYISNVNVSWNVNDPESGIASSTGCGPTTLTANTAGITLECSATNGAGLSTSASVTIKIDMSPPNQPTAIVNPAPNGAGWNNSAATVSFLAMGDNGPSGVALCTSPISFAGETAGTTVGGFCTDFAGNTGSTALVTVRIDETAPVVSNVLATPEPVAVNNDFSLTATVTDPGAVASGVASASYTINGGAPVAMQAMDGDFGQASENVTASVPAFGTDGIYNLCVQGNDVAGQVATPVCIPLPVYDPTAGFVTGGGTINSPAGMDFVNASAAGPANFGFVSKYLKGAKTPSGNLEFQFQAGNLNFKSTSMDWLVVTGEPRAQFHGLGLVNGANSCAFQVDAWDNSFPSTSGLVDAFGIKIYSCNSGGDGNGNRYSIAATPLKQGSIIIHKQ